MVLIDVVTGEPIGLPQSPQEGNIGQLQPESYLMHLRFSDPVLAFEAHKHHKLRRLLVEPFKHDAPSAVIFFLL